MAKAIDSDSYRFGDDHLYTYELAYSRKLWDENSDFRLSVVRDEFDKSTSWDIYDRSMEAGWPLMMYGSDEKESCLRHGVKVSVDMNPFTGFRVTPSFMYLNYEQPDVLKSLGVPTRVLGLNARITNPSETWSVSMAGHYTDIAPMKNDLMLKVDMNY